MSEQIEQDLLEYYRCLYPCQTLVKWLTYNENSKHPLIHRELSFEYRKDDSKGDKKDTIVERYVRFADADKFKERMIETNKVPLKIDAGAIWDQIPEKGTNGKTIERELIFDFDMNDYDDVRTCCEGKKICQKCWKLIIIAVKILERSLENDFDFHKIMYVFSGGRGLHIWVCDERARKLTDSARKSIADYLQLVTGNDKAASLLAERVIAPTNEINTSWRKGLDESNRQELRKSYITNNFPAQVEESLKILKDYAADIYKEQKVFNTEKCQNIIFKILENRNGKLKERVQKRWSEAKNRDSEYLYQILVEQIQIYESTANQKEYPPKNVSNNRTFKRLTFIEQEIMLSFLYPRMDFNVSTMQNHLLKLPFSVHPSSNKISIPLTASQVQTFNPDECVTLKKLLKELEELKKQNGNKIYDKSQNNEILAKQTHLGQPIRVLEDFIASVCE